MNIHPRCAAILPYTVGAANGPRLVIASQLTHKERSAAASASVSATNARGVRLTIVSKAMIASQQ